MSARVAGLRLRSLAYLGGVGAGHSSQPLPGRLDGSHLGHAVDRYQSELRHIPQQPLEVVDCRPVIVPAEIDSVLEAARDARERSFNERAAARVVFGTDSAFSHDYRYFRNRSGAANGNFEGLGAKLVAHLGLLDARLGTDRTFRPDTAARVVLHANEVVATRRFEEDIFGFAQRARRVRLAAGKRFDLLHRDGHADREFRATRL